jgi:hypothetical protein
MPGAKPYGFRIGDNAELLAEFIISRLAFTSKVPRTEDVGHDFLCSLAEKSGNMYKAGPFFTVQAKSSKKALKYETEPQRNWIKNQENPFFVCIVDRTALSIELFSTWNMLNGFLLKGANRIHLVPGNEGDEYALPQTDEKESLQTIPLGPPILRIFAKDAIDDDTVADFASILKQWIEIDRRNIVNKGAGIYWVIGPVEYETNKPLPDKPLTSIRFYWNPRNLQKCIVNFGRSASALRVVERAAWGEDKEAEEELKTMIQDLERVLISYKDTLEPEVVSMLRSVVNLEF